MTPYYNTANNNYPNIENIKRLSSTSDNVSWLYSSTVGNWWTMWSISGGQQDSVQHVRHIKGDGNLLYSNYAAIGFKVRPVITIIK